MLIKKLFTNAKKSGKNRDRVHSSTIDGISAPDSLGDFFISDLLRECREYNTSFDEIISDYLLSPVSSRNLNGFEGNLSQGTIDMTNEITTFNFNNNAVRTQTINGEPWFCLNDACNILGLKNSSMAVSKNDGVSKIYLTDALGRHQETTFINEPNLYRLIFRSNKPQAQAFADWVYNEVLPSIRKTGSYNSPAVPQVDMKAIGGMVKKCCAVAVRDELKTILLGDKIDMGEVVNWNDIMCRALALRADNIVKSQYTALINENAVLKEKINNIKRLAN